MIQIKAIRTGKQEGYAAVDDFKIIENEECEIFPTDAQPPAPVTTTTVVRNICLFFFSRSLKLREKCISFAQLVLFSFYTF